MTFLSHRKGYTPRSRLNRVGKKGRANAKLNRELKREFERLGITTCELGMFCCTRDDQLSFAHSLKRRHWKEGDGLIAILACWNCHWQIEKLGEAEMQPIVERVISERAARAEM
jgi:hypothetical protein